MEKKINLILILLYLSFYILGCSKESNDSAETAISYLKSELGGCNKKLVENIEQDVSKNDTIIISLSNDTLSIFAGLNYICCAPFITNCEIHNDSILINISDTCSNPYTSCYCRCNCYYTFDFMYNGISNRKYFWQIILSDPSEDNDRIFKEGYIEIRNNNVYRDAQNE